MNTLGHAEETANALEAENGDNDTMPEGKASPWLEMQRLPTSRRTLLTLRVNHYQNKQTHSLRRRGDVRRAPRATEGICVEWSLRNERGWCAY